jgi:hypothetical protein
MFFEKKMFSIGKLELCWLAAQLWSFQAFGRAIPRVPQYFAAGYNNHQNSSEETSKCLALNRLVGETPGRATTSETSPFPNLNSAIGHGEAAPMSPNSGGTSPSLALKIQNLKSKIQNPKS